MKTIFLLLSISQFAWANDSTQFSFKWFPNEKKVSIFTGDSRAHRLGFSRNFDERSYGVSMGNIFPVVNINKGKYTAQINAAGSTYLTLLRLNQAGSVLNSDYFADVFIDFASKSSPFIIRLGTGHSSQHLSDDAIHNNKLPYQNYAKDYHQIMGIYQSKNRHILAYLGLQYNYNFKTIGNISNKALWQLGFVNYPFKNKMLAPFFYAGDLKLREELNYDYTFNCQIGYAFKNEFDHAIRIALNYSDGTDERGYFHPNKRQFMHLGIYFEY
jgi:hypothetical protein